MTLQTRIKPGIYSDLNSFESDMFFMPIAAMLAKNFSQSLSGTIGFEFRYGFDQLFMPIIGLDWEISDQCRLSARLPASLLKYVFNEYGSLYLGFKWNSMSYHLDEDDARDLMTIEDYRFFGGASFLVSNNIYMLVEAGKVSGRQISFENNDGSDIDYDIEDNIVIRVGVHGAF